MQGNFKLIVDSSVAPDVFLKVLQVKQALADGTENSTACACKAVGLSRSAFYKYKDHISTYEDNSGKIFTLHAVLVDKAGVLTTFLKVLHESGANVLTVNQNIPSGRRAPVSVSFRVKKADFSMSELITTLKNTDGVKRVDQLFGE